MSVLVTLISGAWAGLLSSAMFYPLDTIEARQQIDKGLFGCTLSESAQKIWEKDGLIGFYIGWQPGIFGVSVNWAVYFLLYDYFGNIMVKQPTLLLELIRGIITGILTSVVVNPFWVLKNDMITNFLQNKSPHKKNTGFLTTISYNLRSRGIRHFYLGVIPSMLGCTQGAIQFVIYPILKDWLILFSSSHIQVGTIEKEIVYFLAGSAASLIATIVTYPYQTIRTYFQVKRSSNPSSGLSYIYRMYTEGGISVFYAGLTTNLIRQVPTSGCMLCIMEITKQILLGYTSS